VGCESDSRHGRDEPFGRVVLEPLDCVSEIHRELMMEVVVSFTNGAESSKEVIAGSVLVIERLVSEPVSERVDTEGGLKG
jgi:galactokinase/mevalonate kinase-like predicted kinase